MPDVEFAKKLGEIRHFIWQQDWENAQAMCQEILDKSPTALAFLKISLNSASDWVYGMQRMAGEGLWQYYANEEAIEGRRSYLEKRRPDFRQFRK